MHHPHLGLLGGLTTGPGTPRGRGFVPLVKRLLEQGGFGSLFDDFHLRAGGQLVRLDVGSGASFEKTLKDTCLKSNFNSLLLTIFETVVRLSSSWWVKNELDLHPPPDLDEFHRRRHRSLALPGGRHLAGARPSTHTTRFFRFKINIIRLDRGGKHVLFIGE